MSRNITLDYFKLCLTIPIISAHIIPWTEVNFLQCFVSGAVARVAVACFFIINGYFMVSAISDKKKLKTILAKLLLIYVVWTLIYAQYAIVYIPNKKELLINLLFGYYHLWYIAALIPAVIMLYLLRNVAYWKVLLLCLFLFATGLTIHKLDLFNVLIGQSVQSNIYVGRNFLFFGFPFLYLGYYFKKNDSWVKTSITTTKVAVLIAVATLGLFIESILQHKSLVLGGVNSVKDDFYFFQFLLAPALVLLFLKIGKHKDSDGLVSHLATAVYFCHILVLINFGFMNMTELLSLPMAVFFSMLVGVGVVALNKRVKMFL